MKLYRIILIFLVLATILLCTVSCGVKPEENTWYLQGYKKSVTFIGGIERDVNFAEPSVEFPFTEASNDKTNITFSADGKVNFMTDMGEKLEGTYVEGEGGGLYDSYIVTFETGETVKMDFTKFMGMKFLNFTFRDVLYYFCDENQLTPATVDSVVYEIRNKENIAAKKCTISKTESGYKLAFEEKTLEIENSTAIFACRIDSMDNFYKLNEVIEGECLACFVEEADYLVIYYVEPKA